MEERKISGEAVRDVLREYWKQYRAMPMRTLIGFLLPGIGVVLGYFVPALIVGMIADELVANGTDNLERISWLVAAFTGVWLSAEVLWRIGMHQIIRLEANGMDNLFQEAFRRLSERDHTFFTNNFVGSLTKRGMVFGRAFERFTDTLVFNVGTKILPIIFATVVLWGYSPWLPLLLLGWLIIAVLVALPIIKKRAQLVYERHAASSRMSGRLSDALTNALAIKSYAKEEEEQESYGEHVDDFTKKMRRAADFQNLRFDTVIGPMFVLANATGLIAVLMLMRGAALPISALIVVFSYYGQITQVFWQITQIYRNLEHAVTESAEFTQMFLEPPAVVDAPHAKPLHVTDGEIVFDQVRFSYPEQQGRAEVFMDGLNLRIPAKQKIGLVGPSGGGKSTVTKLLLRYIDLSGGAILIDGQDISAVTQFSLRRNIAYVPQDPLLFHRTLLENIGYGNNEATEEEIIEAARLAHADEFIRELPKGYQTLVGERGIKLSGGQRQRVAIARAILKNAPILLLDEATSSLDSESERYIQDGLKALMQDKTAIVIAHRLSTIKHLDRIVVLDQGRVVQDGSHEQLSRERGLYARLWKHQSGDYLSE